VERVLAWYGRRAALSTTRAAPTPGNLFAPRGWPAAVAGGFRKRRSVGRGEQETDRGLNPALGGQ
jgi:hypothetical protein